jgi:segregation and condensation protein A
MVEKTPYLDNFPLNGNPVEDLVELIHQPTWKTILLSLVKTNKMDPWDIDVCLLSDRYLAKINSLGENNLRLPANAILASAILLKYKSKYLKIASLAEFEEAEDELTEAQKKDREKLYLTEGIPELIPPRNIMREGKVTLEDLVGAIESVLNKTKRKRALARERKLHFHIPFAEQRMEDKMNQVLKEVEQHADAEGLVLFSRLVEGKTALELISIFVALLFLTNESKITLWQDEFFGELFVSLIKEEKEV